MTEKEQEDLSAYLDDALSPAEKARVEQALAGSAELRRGLTQLRRLQSALKELPPMALPAGFAEEIRRRAAPKPRRVWFYVPTFVAAAAAALVMVRITREEKALETVLQSQRPAAPAMEADRVPADKFREPSPPASAAVGQKRPMMAQNEDKLERRSTLAGRLDFDAASKDDANVKNFAEEAFAAKEKKVAANGEREARDFAAGPKPAAIASAPAQEGFQRQALRTEPSALGGAAGALNTDGAADGPNDRNEGNLSKAAKISAPQEWAGNHRAFGAGRQVVIRTGKEWESLWAEIHGYQNPAPAAPPVLFPSQMVVGVLLDEKPSGGHAVRITHTELSGQELRVYYRITQPPSGTVQIAVMTQPYHLLTVPSHDGKVRFIKE